MNGCDGAFVQRLEPELSQVLSLFSIEPFKLYATFETINSVLRQAGYANQIIR